MVVAIIDRPICLIQANGGTGSSKVDNSKKRAICEKIGETTEVNEADWLERVPLSSVSELIAAGKIWNSSSLVARLWLLTLNGWVRLSCQCPAMTACADLAGAHGCR
jgi:hypothetical protein